jgi:hypothetical protein
VPILVIWAKRWEPEEEEPDKTPPGQSSNFSSSESPGEDFWFIEYPYTEVLEFAKSRPIFHVDGTGVDMSQCNFVQAAFYNYLSPVIYFCRLPIAVVFVCVEVALGAFRCPWRRSGTQGSKRTPSMSGVSTRERNSE